MNGPHQEKMKKTTKYRKRRHMAPTAMKRGRHLVGQQDMVQYWTGVARRNKVGRGGRGVLVGDPQRKPMQQGQGALPKSLCQWRGEGGGGAAGGMVQGSRGCRDAGTAALSGPGWSPTGQELKGSRNAIGLQRKSKGQKTEPPRGGQGTCPCVYQLEGRYGRRHGRRCGHQRGSKDGAALG